MAKKGKSRVEFNKGWAEELMQSPKLRAHLEQLGDQGETYAESIAPRDKGTYAASFESDVRVVGDRLMLVITNTSEHGALVELHNNGTGDHVLSRTVQHLQGL